MAASMDSYRSCPAAASTRSTLASGGTKRERRFNVVVFPLQDPPQTITLLRLSKASQRYANVSGSVALCLRKSAGIIGLPWGVGVIECTFPWEQAPRQV